MCASHTLNINYVKTYERLDSVKGINMSDTIFSNEKIQEMTKFCSSGYEAWSRIIAKDTADKYVVGRSRSAAGLAYWESFNSEISCILAIHTFMEQYLSEKVPPHKIGPLNQARYNFRISVVEYKRHCSTTHLTGEIDKNIEKNDALKKDRKDNLALSGKCLVASVNDISSKIGGIVATFSALKGMKKNMNSLDASRVEIYKTLRRDFLAVASNVIGLFVPTAIGNSIIVAWMASDIRDLAKFDKTGEQLAQSKQELLKAAGTFSGDTKIGDFYTYVLVTALAEHYGFAPNNGIKYNLKHEHLGMAKGILS